MRKNAKSIGNVCIDNCNLENINKIKERDIYINASNCCTKKTKIKKNGLSRTPTPTMNNKKLMSNNPSSNIKFPTSNAAITLIALIITVIVLLILAGVTLNMVIGENGIIRKAQLAKEKINQSLDRENKELKELDEKFNLKKIKAEKVLFTPKDSNWKVENVKEALDSIYN